MTLKEVKSKLSKFENSLASFQTKLETAMKASTTSAANPTENLSALEQEFREFSERISPQLAKVKTSIEDFEKRLALQEAKTDELAQYSRRNCLLLHGVSESPDEDVYEKVIDTIKGKLQIELNMDAIDRCHRLGRPKRTAADVVATGNRPIIVKFLRYHQRNRVWRAKRQLKGTNMLITESLTETRMKILSRARDIFGVKKTYTQDGRIIVITPDERKHHLNLPEELEALIRQFGRGSK